MSDAAEGATATVTDEVLDDLTLIGPIEARVRGSWDRVESALGGLDHVAVVYRFRHDSTGTAALFIEVQLPGLVDPERLLEYRDRIRSVLAELGSETPVYVHFVSIEPVTDEAS